MILNIVCLISLMLLIMFKTEAWVEYCKLLKLDFISKYINYEFKKTNDVSLEYIQYIRQYHDCFFVRLITCPICLSIWLSIILSIITWSLPFILIYIIGSLLLFATINKLLK